MKTWQICWVLFCKIIKMKNKTFRVFVKGSRQQSFLWITTYPWNLKIIYIVPLFQLSNMKFYLLLNNSGIKACVRYFSKKNVFLRYFKRSISKRNLTYSRFFFPSFHEHSVSLELPRAARLLKTSCFKK